MATGIKNDIIYYLGGKANVNQFVSVDPNNITLQPADVCCTGYPFGTTNEGMIFVCRITPIYVPQRDLIEPNTTYRNINNKGQYYSQYADTVYMLIWDAAGRRNFFKTFDLGQFSYNAQLDDMNVQLPTSLGGCVATDSVNIYVIGGRVPGTTTDRSNLQIYSRETLSWTDGLPLMAYSRYTPACIIATNTKELFVKCFVFILIYHDPFGS